jgi:hypothetical protein
MNNHGSKGALLWADITTMQAMAFYGAALAAKIDGVVCRAQIAVPGATHDHEADSAITAVLGGTLAVCDDAGHVPGYVKCPVGLVLGTPRGCFRADKMLSPGSNEGPRFLVFDTDQLTETVFGLSRTDSRRVVVSELTLSKLFDLFIWLSSHSETLSGARRDCAGPLRSAGHRGGHAAADDSPEGQTDTAGGQGAVLINS